MQHFFGLLAFQILLAARGEIVQSANSTGLEFDKFDYTEHHAVQRRLFSLSGALDSVLNSASSVATQAENWVSDEIKQVGSALGIDKVLAILRSGQSVVGEGVKIAKAGWTSMTDLVTALMSIFTNFAPLKPVFADKNGLMDLLGNKDYIRILVQTIQNLLGTSNVMRKLSSALHQVADMFRKISTFISDVLSKVTGRRRLLADEGEEHSEWHAAERRLMDFTTLLSKLNFKTMAHTFSEFVPQVEHFTSTLTNLDVTLGPLLRQANDALSGGRRLGITEDQKKYSEAISQVIPTWQGVESLGMSVCPFVMQAVTGSDSLKCRVAGFISQSGVFGSISGIVSGCDQSSQQQNTCPTTSMSAGIKNLLGENSQIIGLILAVVAAVALLIGGGGAAAMGGGFLGGEEDSEEHEEEEEDGEDEEARWEEFRNEEGIE